MRTSFLILGLLFAGIASAANEPSTAVDELKKFMSAESPKLYQGSDDLGNCRLLVYSQTDERNSKVWLEGAFQAKDGAATGFPIVFMLSSDVSLSRVEEFNTDENSFWARVSYPSENGQEVDESMSVYVVKEAGIITTIFYETRGIKRACQQLARIL
ncbi:MAG TPA: hypothetical protein DCS07_07195 [Bdellovibrionales bacterium]|nr:MAG: hypothetical protein A2Z97_01045 [Bdellovibrionales bacterium GWB1_52_6]OFZ03606.1 MAG: hypothetical protein A2X97_00750 [Bdellovibrionales bacterium GWA1_52_35]OFZ34939.1 MAG: hypothetical protein A2070_14470 [Bdellovibrionales bacterium GWC1_52_8]HAR42405.1 hypothetical protein [Bdellovibrionales bacterium]HCM40671.1 hypothetical protein [Bdellovibrionales bacterium]